MPDMPDGMNDNQQRVHELSQRLRESEFAFLIPNTQYSLKEIYRQVKQKWPNLCDDNYRCSEHCHCHDTGAEWKHVVRTAKTDLNRRRNQTVTLFRKGLCRGEWIYHPTDHDPTVAGLDAFTDASVGA
jgi:hypothetical protein